MIRWRMLAWAVLLSSAAVLASPAAATAQTNPAAPKPDGEMRFALYVTLAPAWLDPAEAARGFITPFWVLYAGVFRPTGSC